ncbi:MAG: MFS transporter [Clostridiales bacterium]|nr:MFS transporter [Clostridiales bacterium]
MEETKTQVAEQKGFTKKEKSWILYDVANSAYVMLATALLSLYFNYLSPSGNLSSVWGLTNVIVTIIAVVLCPILGTYADFSKKRGIFMMFALIGICSCGLLSLFSFISKFTIAGILFLIVYIITEVGFASANVFYDSMLNDITTDEKMHKVSANGFAWGYICSCIPFALCLGAYVLGNMVKGFEWFQGPAFSVGCLITAVWWLVFTLPLLKNYKQTNFMPRPEKPIRATFSRLGSLFKEFKKNKKALLFLVAFFFYIDGVHTIIKMATALGTDLGFDQVKLVIMLFVTQFVAFPCALIFGKLSAKVACEKLLLVAIIAYTAIGVFAVFLTQEWQCWILVVSVGMFQGGVQAMSRSYFTKLVPADKTGEFFGIYDIFGKSAAILGLGLTSLLGIFFPLSNSTWINISLIPLPVLFAIGLGLFLLARKKAPMEGTSAYTEAMSNPAETIETVE